MHSGSLGCFRSMQPVVCFSGVFTVFRMYFSVARNALLPVGAITHILVVYNFTEVDTEL